MRHPLFNLPTGNITVAITHFPRAVSITGQGTHKRVQQGRLTRAVAPDYGNNMTLGHFDTRLIQSSHLAIL